MLTTCLAVAAPLLVTMSGSASGTPTTGSQARSTPGPRTKLEMDLTGNASTMTMGEPEIAVNPVNPNELYVDGATFPVPIVFNGPSPIPYTCGGMVSENRGLSWQPAPFPQTHCEDGVAAFGPDGTLYAGGNVETNTSIVPAGTPGAIQYSGAGILVEGYLPIYRSNDGGHNWSASVEVKGSASWGSFPDRPWLVVDQSTNTVYVAAHNIANHQGFITASTNKARSFGPIHAIDSQAYPTGGFGGNIAAAHGVLAVAYGASKAPGAGCPCVIFETSTDHGATFTRHVVPLVNAAQELSGEGLPGGDAIGLSPFITADPASKGHFALTVFNAAGTKNQVYVTHDSGKTWHGPRNVGEAPANKRFKPWLSYGPSGQLALVWRTLHRDKSYDVWAAISRTEDRHGPVFSAPARISSVAAPYPKNFLDIGGDDYSFIIPDRKYVHVGWGDSRDVPVGGGVQIWYARIPVKSFGTR